MEHSNLRISRYSLPTVTGAPQVRSTPEQPSGAQGSDAPSFQQVLQERIRQNSNLAFSKHAVNRVMERGIDISPSNMQRLNEGMRLAAEKGLEDTLILVDRTAFIVNVKNATVITTMDGDSLQGNVFTNIDGTVII